MNEPSGCVPMIDVSAAQGVVDWPAVYASGVRAVYIEHGVGNDTANPCAAAQVAGARAAGLIVGRYDFVFPIGIPGAGRDPIAQASRHAAIDWGPYDLPAVVDVEWPAPEQWGRWGCTASQIVQWVFRYSLARPEVTRVYISPGFLASLGYPPEFSRFDLWLAAWEGGEPKAPAPFGSWAAWQHSSGGHVPGVTGAVDLSWLRVPPSAVSTIPDLGPCSEPTLPAS